MALLEIKADLSRVALALERIADILDYHFKPIYLPTPQLAEFITSLTEEEMWQKEQDSEKDGGTSEEELAKEQL